MYTKNNQSTVREKIKKLNKANGQRPYTPPQTDRKLRKIKEKMEKTKLYVRERDNIVLLS